MMKREQSNHQSDNGYDEWADFGEEDKENSYPDLAYEHSIGTFSPKKVILQHLIGIGIIYRVHNREYREKN